MSRKKSTHLHFTPGKRLFVKMVDGSCFVDKFVETRSRHIVLDERGKVMNCDLLSVTIYRGERI
ncbi:hypothetical protein [Rhodopila sp.]|uniref:hypothetical protein n=1 Tax=Rhodopila sp. TaxID=2480087 RepID=UPI003D116005